MRVRDLCSLVSTPQTPRGDRIVVLPLQKARHGLLVDMEENRERPEQGVVLAVGPGATGPETGRFVPVTSVVGELVTYGRYAGMAFEAQGGPRGAVTVFVMRDAEVLLAQDGDTVDLEMHDADPNKVHLAGLVCDACPKASGDARLDRLRALAEGRDKTEAVPVGAE